ncbi:uncharacterized protein LOC117318872 [Pecten maximus]|uniref:uncharacterized protein LOC117318872 n=1 Tax=Pecten maximus TaxID=6579 RepID=UPI001459112A|nr:uncharacterized protein LOC117318872 [Pecten maximus]
MAAAPAATDSLKKIPDNISPSFLPDSKSLSDKVLQKGLNYFSQGYIHNIKIKETENDVRVDARCWRSMRKSEEPHRLHVDIGTETISQSFCSCKVGLNGHCSHIVGLLKSLQGFKLHNFSCVPDQQSCTSVPQQWHVPRGAKIQPVPLNQVVVARPKEDRKRKPLTCGVDENYRLPEVTTADKLKLAALNGTPLQHLMFNSAPELTTEVFGQLPLGSILSYQTRNLKKPQVQVSSDGCGDTCVTKPPPITLPIEFKDLNQQHHIDQDQATQIEIETRAQASSQLWLDSRKNRVTSSNFGKILKRKAKPSSSFLDTIFDTKQIHSAPLEYGKRTESSGKRKYLKQFPSRHFHECGLVVNPEFSFLGASPDGKLCCDGQSGIAEIKCPFSARNMTITNACDQAQRFCLEKVNGKMNLKKSHEYYAQVQGQLMITGCDFCEFIVYTHCDLFVQRILPDIPYMTDMLYKLSTFYKEYAPRL